MENTVTGGTGAIARRGPRAGGLTGFAAILEALADFPRRLVGSLTCLPVRYESRGRIGRLPWVSVDLGADTPDGRPRRARGVIAVGNEASGVLALGIFFAQGWVAVGLRAVGACAIGVFGVGLLSVSVVGLGLVSVSVAAAGYLAVGILAVGYHCVGIFVLGQEVVGIMGLGGKVRALFRL